MLPWLPTHLSGSSDGHNKRRDAGAAKIHQSALHTQTNHDYTGYHYLIHLWQSSVVLLQIYFHPLLLYVFQMSDYFGLTMKLLQLLEEYSFE